MFCPLALASMLCVPFTSPRASIEEGEAREHDASNLSHPPCWPGFGSQHAMPTRSRIGSQHARPMPCPHEAVFMIPVLGSPYPPPVEM